MWFVSPKLQIIYFYSQGFALNGTLSINTMLWLTPQDTVSDHPGCRPAGEGGVTAVPTFFMAASKEG
jgi:hypothetical protein